MSKMQPELNDIQGLLRFGYKHLTQAAFLLLRVRDRRAARDWLASAPVTSAVTQQPPPDIALQVALSSDGLRALGVADDVIDGFSPEFRVGLGNDTSRARRLGDVGPSAPPLWQWGAGQRVPHVLVLLYARAGSLDEWQQVVQAECSAGFELMACLPTADMDGVEPFGFIDGLSQPELDWERQRPVVDDEQFGYSNRACLGEFLLGYPNEYAGYTDRPLLHPAREGARWLPRAEDAPDQADLGRNGSYLVLRQLQQDVHGFWQFLDRQVNGDAGQRQRLAERMVGRTLQGQPLVGDGATPNAFTYESDPDGLRCPLGAHIRRSNPRNADLPPGGNGDRNGLVSRLARTLGFDAAALQQDRVASTRFHRLLRRGREYGVLVPLAQALAARPVGGGDVSGLHFISLGASIARQFEFVQGAWLAGTRFDGLAESDPLLGPRVPGLDGAATDMFSIPQANGPTRRVSGLPHFVTVRGGGYFFLPGLRALRYLATA